MNRLLTIAMLAILATNVAQAQPKARRQQQQQQKKETQQKQGGQQMTRRMQISFPTALDMPEEVVWRRDIYRELNLEDDANGGLYYPVEPVGRQLNLFTYVFKLALNGYIPVYEYRLDGNESFEPTAKVEMKTILDNYHIFYEEKDGKLQVDNSDIPSAEVKMYYIKESAYYDQQNAAFHVKVLALCPVMMREDDFGGEAAKYPLFWVKYSDLEPFLSRQTVMTSNLNNAATMTADDYFTMNRYQGKIYKTNNMLGKTLAQYCPTDSAMKAEQSRIEAELEAFRKSIFGKSEAERKAAAKKDSITMAALTPFAGAQANIDSIAKVNPKEAKRLAREQEKARKEAEKAAKKAAKEAEEQAESEARAARKRSKSSGSSTGRISVRRQRH